jgi:hypothetical protein
LAILRKTGVNDAKRRDVLWLLGAVGLSAIALLVSPYGPGLPMFLLRTGTVPRPDIAEWAPMKLMSYHGVVYLLLAGIVGYAVTLTRQRKPVLVILLVVIALAPLTAVRHLPLFGLAVAILAGPMLGNIRGASPVASRPATPHSKAIAVVLTPLVMTSAVCVVMAVPNFRCIHLEPASFLFPVRATALLQASGARGNVVTMFNWGEYLIWQVGPQIKVSIDGRRETVYSSEMRQKARNFEHGRERWDAILDDPTDLALVQTGSAAANLLQRHPGWQLVYEDAVARLFSRRESRIGGTIAATPVPGVPADGSGLCFPAHRGATSGVRADVIQ